MCKGYMSGITLLQSETKDDVSSKHSHISRPLIADCTEKRTRTGEQALTVSVHECSVFVSLLHE